MKLLPTITMMTSNNNRIKIKNSMRVRAKKRNKRSNQVRNLLHQTMQTIYNNKKIRKNCMRKEGKNIIINLIKTTSKTTKIIKVIKTSRNKTTIALKMKKKSKNMNLPALLS